MRKLLLLLFICLTLTMQGSNTKLWVSIQYDHAEDRVYLIEDLETKTRCYAITNSKINLSGYAISCVKSN